MTPAQLKTEIQTGPLAAALAPLVAAGNDVGVAALLNARTLRGLVPILEMARYCAKGITGGVQAALETPIGTGGMTAQIKGALHTVMNLVQQDFRMEACDVDDPVFGSVCDGVLIPFGIMTATDKTNILALGANRQSRVEFLFGQQVSMNDISLALRGY